MIKVLMVGSFGPGALENSYASGFRDNGCEVIIFDISTSVMRNCRLGIIGQTFNKFVPVEPWIRKANREMILEVTKHRPDMMVIFGQNMVLTSALAQIKAMSSVKTAYIWQDTLLFLGPNQVNSLPLYDLVCTYSKSNIKPMECLGAKNVIWLPLGADPHIHSQVTPREEFMSDLAFIGQWRPEREAVISAIISNFPNLKIRIWGLDWKRRSKNEHIKNIWQGRALYGKEFAQAIVSAKFNINIIDDTNYPAANMRFFEILCAGGLQICSSCPEMENDFVHGDTILYFKDFSELVHIIKNLETDTSEIKSISRNGHIKVMESHTYKNRAQKILDLINSF